MENYHKFCETFEMNLEEFWQDNRYGFNLEKFCRRLELPPRKNVFHFVEAKYGYEAAELIAKLLNRKLLSLRKKTKKAKTKKSPVKKAKVKKAKVKKAKVKKSKRVAGRRRTLAP